MKELWNRLLFYISVPKCVSCKGRLSYGDAALCPSCAERYSELKLDRCTECTRLLSECDCAPTYLRSHFVSKLIKIFRYRNEEERLAANALIYSLKRDNRRDVLRFLAAEVSSAIRNSVKIPENLVVTNVPRRRSAIVKYGIDHAALLAKEVAKELGAEYLDILKSSSKRAQKKLTNEQRRLNVDYSVKRELDLSGKRVMLIDDIVTTGTSMGSAATLLRGLGAKGIIGVCIAIAYRDKNSFE